MKNSFYPLPKLVCWHPSLMERNQRANVGRLKDSKHNRLNPYKSLHRDYGAGTKKDWGVSNCIPVVVWNHSIEECVNASSIEVHDPKAVRAFFLSTQ